MTDESNDQVLRSALEDEARTMATTPNWDDVLARASTPNRRPLPGVAIAAVLVLVVAVVGIIALRPTDDPPALVTSDPSQTSIASTTSSPSATSSTSTPSSTPPVSGQLSSRPGRTVEPVDLRGRPLADDEFVAVVSRDGADEAMHDLVVLDTAGNTVRTLLADVGASEGGIYDVTVSANREVVIFSRGTSACEGIVLATRADGASRPIELFAGDRGRLSPSGRTLLLDPNTPCLPTREFELIPLSFGGESTIVAVAEDDRPFGAITFVDDSTVWWTFGGTPELYEFDVESGSNRVIDPLGMGGTYRQLRGVGNGTVAVVHEVADSWTAAVVDVDGVVVTEDLDGPTADVAFLDGGVLVHVGPGAGVDFDGASIHDEVFALAVPSVPQPDARAAGQLPLTTLPGGPSLSPAQREAAAAVVEEFTSAVLEERFVDARELWNGYPDFSADDPDGIVDFLAANLRARTWAFTDPDVGPAITMVAPAWSFVGGTAIVTQTFRSTDGGTTRSDHYLVHVGDDGEPAVLTRIPETFRNDITPSAGATVRAGDRIVIGGVPVEGGARAYFEGIEVPVTVDHETFEMSVVVPDDLAGDVALSLSAATPEAPTAWSWIYTIEE